MEYHDLPTKGNVQYDDRTTMLTPKPEIISRSITESIADLLNRANELIRKLREENIQLHEELEKINRMISDFRENIL